MFMPEDSRHYLSTFLLIDIHMDSYRSNLTDIDTGIGFVIFQLGRQSCARALPLYGQKKMYYADDYATIKRIIRAFSKLRACFANDMRIFVDNAYVARRLSRRHLTDFSQAVLIEFIDAAELLKTQLTYPCHSEGQVNICWIPSHCGF